MSSSSSVPYFKLIIVLETLNFYNILRGSFQAFLVWIYYLIVNYQLESMVDAISMAKHDIVEGLYHVSSIVMDTPWNFSVNLPGYG